MKLLQCASDEAKKKGVSRSVIFRWALLKYFESEKVAV
jgi:hypothetical protein